MTSTDHQHADPGTLRDLLDARRRQLLEDLHLRMARIREQGSSTAVAKEPDDGDACELDVVLVDIATSTLRRIDHAMQRLEAGRYGLCTRCRHPIAEARLRALPFAVCCQRCEAAREQEAAMSRQHVQKRLWEGHGAEQPFPSDEPDMRSSG